MRTAIFRLAAIFALIAGAVTFGVAASADNTNPNGAQVINVHECQPQDGYTECIDEHFVFQNVDDNANPAGNASFTVNGQECLTQTDPSGATLADVCQQVHEHILFTPDTIQEEQAAITVTFVTPAGTFCVTENLHEANGQVQYYNTAFVAC
jgi:hypothetical protein